MVTSMSVLESEGQFLYDSSEFHQFVSDVVNFKLTYVKGDYQIIIAIYLFTC